MRDALSIDIETLGLKPNALVLQVGLCLVNLDTGEKWSYSRLNLRRRQQRTRAQEPGTIQWWSEQSPELQASVLNSPEGTRVSIETVHEVISEMVTEGRTIWANSPSFDCVILASLFNSVDLDTPWGFRDERCLRTLAKHIDPDGKLKPPANPTPHDALCDATWQAEYLYRLLKEQA